MLKTEEDIIELIQRDEYMMGILRTVNQLGLDDYWVGAGFVRNKVWDTIFNYRTRTPYNDTDVVYFDSENISKEADELIEKSLVEIRPEIPFEVVNQARMFLKIVM